MGDSKEFPAWVKATPRPWQIHRNEHGVRYEVGPVINNFFTCAYVSGFYSREAEANAELIVEAVNSYDDLRAENKELREVCEAAETQLAYIYQHALLPIEMLDATKSMVAQLRQALRGETQENG